MTTIFEQYKQAQEVVNGLASQLYSEFMALSSVEEKFKCVYEHGSDFLRDVSYYCPHVYLDDGSEVSLYDDLYVDRHQTINLSGLIENLLDDLDVDWDEADDNMFERVYVYAINQDNAVAAIIRDMLNKGINTSVYDW